MKNKDIAKALGISEAAVSLARNNRPGVSEETREKVFRLLGKSGDKKDAARNGHHPVMTDGKIHRPILLSIHKKNGRIIDGKAFFAELIEAIQQEALKLQRTLTVVHFTPGMDLKEYIDYIRQLNSAGIIIVATELNHSDLEAYESLNIPMVILDNYSMIRGADVITLDTQVDMTRSVEYAYKKGHRRIGYLKSEVRINNFDQHMLGFQEGLRLVNLKTDEKAIFTLPETISGSYQKMKKKLENLPKDYQMPTCFLADLDYIAIGAMQAFREMGYDIPKDVSFIGYDDIAACEASTPPLTSVRVPNREMGILAIERLTSQLESESSRGMRVQMPSVFVERESVADLTEAS